MNASEWDELADLLAMVEKAVCEACEFIANHMEREIKDRLCKAGVSNYVEEAYQETLLNLRCKLCQLQEIDLFEGYLRRVVMSSTKKYRPRTVPHPRLALRSQQRSERPREIGSKTITIDGKPQVVRIFEPNQSQEHGTARTPVFEPCSNTAIVKWSKANFPDYPHKIDVWSAMAKLPNRWAAVLWLREVEQYTAAETADIMRASVARVYRLAQLAKARMRKLMPGYPEKGRAVVEAARHQPHKGQACSPVSDVSPGNLEFPLRRVDAQAYEEPLMPTYQKLRPFLLRHKLTHRESR